MSGGEPVDPWLGKSIEGRYVLRRRIGKGGMGVVYEADHAALDRRVAIKLIAAKEAPEAYLVRFRREAKLASRISHEHLVHIYDVGTDPESGADYMVMEYVEGRDLGKELSAGALSISRTISIAKQLLAGLQAVHEGGIVHRDIKPSNVMLTSRAGERDFVKLMDFGVARAIGDASLTVTGHVVGTPNFMAPEQLRGQEVDHRTDLYAVGVTLFAMIAGKLPFEGNTAALAGAHVFQPPPSVAKLRPETPAALAAAVDRALAKAPADRFPDAKAFAAALDGTAPALVLPPIAPTVSTKIERPRPKHDRTPWIAGGLAAAAAIGGTIWYLVRPSSSSTTAPPDPVATRPAPPPPIDAAVVAVVAVPDAATVDVPAATSAGPDTPIAPPDKLPVHRTDAGVAAVSGPKQRCQCVPTSAPDIYGLCPTSGTPLCRCNTTDGKSLCPTTLVPNRTCQTYGNRTECRTDGEMCADQKFAKFHTPGRVGTACSGYTVPSKFDDWSSAPAVGKLDCDTCPGAKLNTFEGREGEPCNGFYWRTGEPKAGRLAHCE